MISALISWLVLVIIVALLYWVLTQIPLPPPFLKIIQVVCVVIVVLALIFLLLPLVHVAGLPR